eukprot:m.46651 g.46651  ORF g.46651 m.46651 type:complete len:86 (+) comp33716_c0_seq3:2368-2625(+)
MTDFQFLVHLCLGVLKLFLTVVVTVKMNFHLWLEILSTMVSICACVCFSGLFPLVRPSREPGWCQGSTADGRSGLIPENYIEMLP